MLDVSLLSDDDLRSAVNEARIRLPHYETCEHCEGGPKHEQRVAAAHHAALTTFNERAAAAGFLHVRGKSIVHRWDCPSILAYVRDQVTWFESLEPDAAAALAERDFPAMHFVLMTAEEAREFRGRGCRKCSPNL